MLAGLTWLLVFQCAGEALVRLTGMPVPGPVVGMMLLGLGDVRLAGLIGLLLGWYGLQWVLYAAIIGNLLVLIVALVTCIHQRRLLLRFSFGPSLIAGAWITIMIHG